MLSNMGTSRPMGPGRLRETDGSYRSPGLGTTGADETGVTESYTNT
jgi:hypothetical protein